MIVKTKDEIIGGFTEENDIFNRKNFGNQIKNIISNSNNNLIIALDAEWGEGKTTFIKMWVNEYSKELDIIYYDAFLNDYKKDPFLSITSEVYSKLSEEKQDDTTFIEKTKSVASVLTRGAIKIGLRLATNGLLTGKELDGVEDDIHEVFTDALDKALEKRIKENEQDKLIIEGFKNYISTRIESLKSKKLVFIIDELDRCRQIFALELLEQIKHIFNINNLYFILVINKKQIEAAVNSNYGKNISTSNYLQKFIDIWLSLPNGNDQDRYRMKYVDILFKKMTAEYNNIKNVGSIHVIKSLVQHKNLSFRSIEKILHYFAIINLITTQEYNQLYQQCIGILCVVRVISYETFQEISTTTIDSNKLLDLLQIKNLGEYSDEYLLFANKAITYDLTKDPEQRENIKKEGFFQSPFPDNRKSALKEIASWMTNLSLI